MIGKQKLTLQPKTSNSTILPNALPANSKQAIGARRLAVTDQNATEDSKNSGYGYRFDHLSLVTVLRDMYFSKDSPGPGDRVPEFDLPTVDGGRFRSSDLAESGPALLVFGSITCPVTDNAAPGLKDLHARFGDRVRFVMVSVREAHPGKAFPQPKTFALKMSHARRLRELHEFEFEVAVDDLDGSLHRALSPKPNSAYVLGTDATILFRAHWANDTKALAEALDNIVAGKSPRRSQSSGLLNPTVRILRNIAPVLDRAGSGAWADMWRIAPPLAAIAFALKLLRIGPRQGSTALRLTKPRSSSAAHHCG